VPEDTQKISVQSQPGKKVGKKDGEKKKKRKGKKG